MIEENVAEEVVPTGVVVEIERALGEARAGGEVSAEEILEIERLGTPADVLPIPSAGIPEPEGEVVVPDAHVETPALSNDIRSLISRMRVPEKIKLATLGNSIARGLLIRDPLKLVQLFVLRNPRLTSKEVEDFSRNPNLSEYVLRAIANSQTWMKLYPVKLHIVSNPKTPADLALKWLRYLTLADMKRLSKSKQVSNVVAMSAKKKVVESEMKR